MSGTATITKKPTVTASFTATMRPTKTPVTPWTVSLPNSCMPTPFLRYAPSLFQMKPSQSGLVLKIPAPNPASRNGHGVGQFQGEITCEKMVVLDHTVNPGEKADFSIWASALSCWGAMCGSISFMPQRPGHSGRCGVFTYISK
jgi:hypothetical protein